MEIVDKDNRPPPIMRGRRVVYRPNHKSFGKFIKSEQVRDVTVDVAQDILELASHLSPRRKDRGNVPAGAAMADRYEIKREAGFLKVSGNVRVKVEIFNEAPSAAPNEFGNKRNKRHRMLGRAGAAFGDFKGPNRFVRPEGI